MATHTTQLRPQTDATRAAADAPAPPPEPPVPGPVRRVQGMTARVVARLRQSPWWVRVLAAGVLAGYELLRGKTRPLGQGPTPAPPVSRPSP